MIGDTHGCIDELNALIKLIAPTKEDLVISLGDAVDRGPSPSGCLATFRNMGALLVAANHEDKLIRFRKREREVERGERKKNEMQLKPIHKASIKDLDNHPDADALWRYIRKEAQPLYSFSVNGKTYVCVHAGVHPEYGMKTDPRLLMRIRSVDATTLRPISYKPDVPEEGIYWANLWKGPETVVFGHNVFPEPTRFDNAIGIDTGCVYGGKLSALVIINGAGEEFVSVAAAQTYYKKGDE